MLILNCTIYTATFIYKCKLLAGNDVDHIYADGNGLVYVDPRPTKASAGLIMVTLCDTVGIINTLVYDGAPEQVIPNTQL